MIRKTLTIFSLIGLLLSVGAWRASYWHVAFFGHHGGVHLVYGCIAVNRVPARRWTEARLSQAGFRGYVFKTRALGISETSFAGTIWLPTYRPAGLLFGQWPTPPWLFIPLWIPIAMFVSVFSLCHYPAHRRRKRKKLGLCVSCGYDLRGSNERCPECGEEFGSTNVEG